MVIAGCGTAPTPSTAALKRDVSARLRKDWTLQSTRGVPPELAATVRDIYASAISARMLARTRADMTAMAHDANSSPMTNVTLRVTQWRSITFTSPTTATVRLAFTGTFTPTTTTIYDRAGRTVHLKQLSALKLVLERGHWRIAARRDSDPPDGGGVF